MLPRFGADRVLFPEYLTWEDRSHEIAGHVVGWLTDRPEPPGGAVARLEVQAPAVARRHSRQAASTSWSGLISDCVPASGRGTAETRTSLTEGPNGGERMVLE